VRGAERAISPAPDDGAADLRLCTGLLVASGSSRATTTVWRYDLCANHHPDHDTIASSGGRTSAFSQLFGQCFVGREAGVLACGSEH